MATLRNKWKLAAVSRETPENTRNSQSQNTLDTEMAQEYISQVSKEIELRVTRKLSKDLRRTVSRILGALSKLDEFLLDPKVRTCSVAVPGTTRNSNSRNPEPNGDRSSSGLCPEAMISSHHSGNLNSSEIKEYPHTSVASMNKTLDNKWFIAALRKVLFSPNQLAVSKPQFPWSLSGEEGKQFLWISGISRHWDLAYSLLKFLLLRRELLPPGPTWLVRSYTEAKKWLYFFKEQCFINVPIQNRKG